MTFCSSQPAEGSAVTEACIASPETDDLERMIVGATPAIVELRRLVRQVAPSSASVLITGPSGSGKEVVARAIHAASNRAGKPFVAVNCGAIPRELLESELFGHEKGSFTGAHSQHRGRFEEADGGTLFLDEIGDMPADMQVKLLRVLEERAVQRVGGRGQIDVDVRIVSATHRNIDEAIDEGRFREDLFYRLAVFPIEIPSLGERAQDVPLLVRHFLKRSERGRPTARFSNQAFERMVAHGWPGNIRELRNLVERANIMFAGQTVGAEQVDMLLLRRGRVSAVERAALWEASERLPAPMIPVEAPVPADSRPLIRKDQPLDLRSVIADLEQRYIEEALNLSGGVVAEAARLLSLQRTTLIEKMRKYDLAKAA
jgi:sigma-54 dependent transcriptional regulator, flagellar regulatory protein